MKTIKLFALGAIVIASSLCAMDRRKTVSKKYAPIEFETTAQASDRSPEGKHWVFELYNNTQQPIQFSAHTPFIGQWKGIENNAWQGSVTDFTIKPKEYLRIAGIDPRHQIDTVVSYMGEKHKFTIASFDKRTMIMVSFGFANDQATLRPNGLKKSGMDAKLGSGKKVNVSINEIHDDKDSDNDHMLNDFGYNI